MISVILDLTLRNSDFQPLYGYTVCWINHRIPLLIFFVAPVFVLITINYIFYILTICYIKRSKKQTKVVKNARAEDSSRIYINLKLAILMGLTWISGIFAAIIEHEVGWYLFIVFNGLQGAFIFIAF
ncbi:putative G-protein coupled receptor Mth-like 3, partial [Dinothrombium tinctorium]